MEIFKDYKYIPRKVIETKEEIEAKHLSISDNQVELDFNIRDIEELIERIRPLNQNELKIFSYQLKSRELQSLILYMPENHYNIELWKINEVIKTRFKKKHLILFFNIFQNHYSNWEFNQYFIEYINEVGNSHEILGISSNAVPVLLKWLEEEYIVESIIEDYFKINRGLDSYLGFWGFKPNRKLYLDCWKYFLTVCGDRDYLNTPIEQILRVLETYNLDHLVEFLNNYLLKLDLEDFQNQVLDYIYYTYDTPLNNFHSYLWDKVSEDAKDKYNIWYADKKLVEFFQGDERYEFWFKYIKNLDAKLLGVNDRQLFLDFGEFVVIEFRYINNAGYIYSREYFDLAYNHKVLRNQVLKDGDYKNRNRALDRVIHGPSWQYKTTRLIWELKNRDI